MEERAAPKERFDRREILVSGSAASGVLLLAGGGFALAAEAGEQLIPWADQPPPVPPPAQGVVRTLTPWESLDSWITPNDKFFGVGHYEWPAIDAATWRLNVVGQVGAPLGYALNDLKARPRQEVTFTLECSGNNGLPFLTSAIGNAKWAGASLADILEAAKIKGGAKEVVFFGADRGDEVLRPGTPLELKFTENFARSMSIDDAMNPANILCYEMNGEPLPAARGAPVRLIAPGWFGIANVKWLRRIEVLETRFMGHFMAHDYVTVREESRDGETVVVQTSVGRGLLKSAPARVTRTGSGYRIDGMAWGPTPITAVEVKIDGGAWTKATLAEADNSPFAWRFWHLDWAATPGEHSITSRAIDAAGNVQPAMDDPRIANKKTYWESNGQITRQIRIV
jgi:DMSO/TMAO reductase YedYZ molybdopterin-dependent catalytic subunit